VHAIIFGLVFARDVCLRGFAGQQPRPSGHQKLEMLIRFTNSKFCFLLLATALLLATGCNVVKSPQKTPTLLKTEYATQAELLAEINRFARVGSMSAKMDLKFEDNSFAQFGSKEVYRSAAGQIVVQRPASIFLRVQVPVIKTDVAQMTSDGDQFRVAILQDGGSGKYKKFVVGSNRADYSMLKSELGQANDDGTIKENVNAFANLRPQHFTDAMLVRPTSDEFLYTHSTIFQVEEDEAESKKSPLRKVTRGYYLLDEFSRGENGQLIIVRRFWFDRNVKLRLARQQIFDARGEIESDITYGREGRLTDTAEYDRLPLQIIVTRPQEKYSMKLTYQSPASVRIGSEYPMTAFQLENSWGLEVLDLDMRLREAAARKPPASPVVPNANRSTRFQ
jgi:hypothetical protein